MPPHAAGPRRLRPQALCLTATIALPLALAACDPERSLAPEAQEMDPPSVATDGTPGFATTPQRILYMTYRNAQNDIFRMDATGKNPVALTSNTVQESAPAWSFDNKRVALVRYRKGASYSRPDIYILNADGTNGHWAGRRPVTATCSIPAGRPTAAGWSSPCSSRAPTTSPT